MTVQEARNHFNQLAQVARIGGWKLARAALAAHGHLLHPSSKQAHFFLPPAAPSSLRSQEITLPNITTPFPSMKATRDKPSQFLKVSQTSGCCGWKLHCAISLDFNECGSSIFFPPVSFPIFHLSLEMRQAERPHRTNPIGEYPTLISLGISRTCICASNSRVWPRVVPFLYTITSP